MSTARQLARALAAPPGNANMDTERLKFELKRGGVWIVDDAVDEYFSCV